MLCDVGQADPKRAEHAGIGMNQDFRDAELIGDGAGVLRAGGAKRDEDVVARVIALGNRDTADRLGHVGVGDAEEAGGEGGQSRVAERGVRSGSWSKVQSPRSKVEGSVL